MFELQVAWHARLVMHDIARLLIFPILAAVPAAAWFWGAGRTDADGKTRTRSSIALRVFAAIMQFLTISTFFAYKADLLFVADARRWWGACATLVLATSPMLMLWAVISHFADASVKVDILDASETTAKATARFMHVEEMQTNIAVAWIAAFGVTLYWLFAIAMRH